MVNPRMNSKIGICQAVTMNRIATMKIMMELMIEKKRKLTEVDECMSVEINFLNMLKLC